MIAHLFQLVESKHIDTDKWDELLKKSKVSFQNHRLFLDVVAENWCAIVWDNYRAVLPIPYTVRWGLKGIFAPPLTAPLSWIGDKPSDLSAVDLILRKKFQRAFFTSYEPLFIVSEPRLYQHISFRANYDVSYNTKRNLYKFDRLGLPLQQSTVEEVLPFIVAELQNEMNVFTPKFIERLKTFLLAYDPCYCYGVTDKDGCLHAGLILVESDSEITALYCASDAFGKKNRMMYALMYHGIKLSIEKGKHFNFGGSSIDSIRYFNHRFGAQDRYYYCWKWDSSPFWFRFALKLRKHLPL